MTKVVRREIRMPQHSVTQLNVMLNRHENRGGFFPKTAPLSALRQRVLAERDRLTGMVFWLGHPFLRRAVAILTLGKRAGVDLQFLGKSITAEEAKLLSQALKYYPLAIGLAANNLEGLEKGSTRPYEARQLSMNYIRCRRGEINALSAAMQFSQGQATLQPFIRSMASIGEYAYITIVIAL